MHPRRLLVPTLLVMAFSLGALAGKFAFDDPSIDNTSRGDSYTCSAPYDPVLNGSDSVPGGEPPPDSDDIASRCTAAAQHRFTMAVGLGGATLASLAGGVIAALRERRHRRA